MPTVNTSFINFEENSLKKHLKENKIMDLQNSPRNIISD